jgi:two-component system, OmpR family, alkaline phosphatase synthesis response regulator PhoP
MPNTQPIKILIVDDEAYIRLLIEQTLEDLEDKGVEIITCDNGTDALQLIQAEQPQLVFMDVMMPKMNGFEVCRAVKHGLKLSQVYIVLLTAKGEEYDRQMGQEAGADRYITKPFDPDEVLDLAIQILKI